MSDDIPTPEFETIPPLDESLGDSEPDYKAGKPPWWKFAGKNGAESGPDKPKESKKRKLPLREPKGGLRKALVGFYGTIGMGLAPFDQSCARLWLDNAENCADAMAEWADANPAVKRVLIQMVTVSAFGKVLTAHSPLIMGMAFHHIPALREKQEQMVANMAEEFARQNAEREK